MRRGLDGAGLAVGIVREIGVRAERLGAVGLPIPVSPLVMRRPPPVLKKVSGLSQPETEKTDSLQSARGFWWDGVPFVSAGRTPT